ncbi:hypothetical protein M0R45_036612 [Rubus argutus]|uniref:Uncharacterized protein n=1 Tax=Rubus argutus TaxID=59490 RepID=A0AAW1VZB5_RUBAR
MKRKRVCARRPQSQSRPRKGLKFRKMDDIMKDNRSKLSGINKLLGIAIPVGRGVGGQSNLTWRLLKSHLGIERYYSTKLHSALNAIHECFEPSKDHTPTETLLRILFSI